MLIPVSSAMQNILAAGVTTPNYFTGGVVTVADGYRYHTFNTSGTLTFVDADGLGTAVDVDYLVVAGGGGGGYSSAGGGGAGGLLTASAYALDATTTVTVGAGGAGSALSTGRGTNGSTSSLGAIAAPSGGGGGGSGAVAVNSGAAGGSGGGARGNTSAAGGAGTVGQGNDGAGSFNSGAPAYGGHGGGGAGAVGSQGSATAGGDGGVGVVWNGSTYAGGGGGGTFDTSGSSGGSGGGGAGGASNTANAAAGTANTGGGGGGGGGVSPNFSGAAGGSGVVIVRYPDDPSMPTVLPTATSLWSPSFVSGSTVTDLTGSNDLTIVGSASVGTSGIYNVINVGATSADYLDGGNVLNVLAGEDFTLVMVFKLTAAAGTQIIQSKRAGTQDGYLFYTASGQYNFQVDTGTGQTISTGTTSTALTNIGYGLSSSGTVQFVRLDGATRVTQAADGDTTVNGFEFRFGRGSSTTESPAAMEWYGAAMWLGSSLSDADIDTAVTELLGLAET